MESSKKTTQIPLGRSNSEEYAENEHPLPKNKTLSLIFLNFTHSFLFSWHVTARTVSGFR
jgi:hypothetical protein